MVATGDTMLRNTIKTCYGLDHVSSEAEVTEIAAAWQPYGSLGVNLIFAAAELGLTSRASSRRFSARGVSGWRW